MKYNLTTIGIVIASLLAIILTYIYAIEFSAFAFALGKVSIAIVLFWLFDKVVLKDIETIDEIKKGNIAYGLLLLSFAILIASAIVNV